MAKIHLRPCYFGWEASNGNGNFSIGDTPFQAFVRLKAFNLICGLGLSAKGGYLYRLTMLHELFERRE